MASQLPDRILLDGEYKSLYSNPLEQYWISTHKKRPVFQVLQNCTRGYVADWEIRSDQLFLTGMEGIHEFRFLFFRKSFRYTLKSLFPRSPNKLVKAKWFSGKLRIPHGKMTLYEPTGYDSRFESEVIITIDKGDVVKTVTLDFAQRSLVIHSVDE